MQTRLMKKGLHFSAAETGKFEKAEELAKLMASEDQTAALEYIAQCRSELEQS